MHWTSIRLELGRTPDYPNGSASRIYLLRLPLTDDGQIDGKVLEEHPDRATVRRLWPSEPDLSGRVIPTNGDWALVFGKNRDSHRTVLLSQAARLVKGQTVKMVEGCGKGSPFKVAELRPL